MSRTQARTVLEAGAKRTAEIETGADGARVFVKRFHARGPIDRHFDARRARSEHAALTRLRALGIAAPEPLAVRRREGSFELVTRWIEGSRPLSELLEEGGATAVVPARHEGEARRTTSDARSWCAAPAPAVKGRADAERGARAYEHLERDARARERDERDARAHEPELVERDARAQGRAERDARALSRVARALGALIAQLHERGVAHPDLHSGNALVLEDGGVALVDAHGLRFGGPLTLARRRADLVTCCADARERTSARFRARVFLAWWRATSASVRERLPARSELAEEIERSARLHRRDVVVRSARRWTRASSVARELRDGDVRGIAARTWTPREIEQAVACSLPKRDSPSTAESTTTDAASRPLVRWRVSTQADDWTSAARLVEHRIASAAPVVLVRKPSRAAVFALPLDASSIEALSQPAPRTQAPVGTRASAQRARLACGLGELCGALADRGLALERGPLVCDLAGRVLVDVGAPLEPCDTFDLSRALAPAHAWRATASRLERARFCVAFLRAWRGSARERAHVRARLVDG